MDPDFDYAEAFKSLDLAAVKKDLAALMTDSQDWWPADFGHYGGAVHPHGLAQRRHLPHRRRPRRRAAAGSSASRRSTAGRTTSASTRRAACSGRSSRSTASKISWADLMVLTGNVALETMGFKTFGFAGGRADVWEPDQDVYWGRETKWLGGDMRYSQGSPGVDEDHGVLVKDDDSKVPHTRDLENPLAAVQMGLIYVNPGRPGRQSRPRRRGQGHPRHLRPHGDERRGNRRADRRRPHLRQDPRRGPGRPRRRRARSGRHRGAGLRLAQQASARGKGADTITSGLEVTWTTTPTKWSNDYFENLFGFEWELTKSPAGAQQWVAKGAAADRSRMRTTRRRSSCRRC